MINSSLCSSIHHKQEPCQDSDLLRRKQRLSMTRDVSIHLRHFSHDLPLPFSSDTLQKINRIFHEERIILEIL